MSGSGPVRSLRFSALIASTSSADNPKSKMSTFSRIRSGVTDLGKTMSPRSRPAAVAEVEGRSVSDVAREAIAALVDARRKDQRFRGLLEENLARHQRLLDLLRDDQT